MTIINSEEERIRKDVINEYKGKKGYIVDPYDEIRDRIEIARQERLEYMEREENGW